MNMHTTSGEPASLVTVGAQDRKRKASDEQLAEAYAELRSVHKVAEKFGMCGQTVHVRLKRLNIDMCGRGRRVTDADREAIREYYKATAPDDFRLDEIAGRLGRTRQFVCRIAGQLGLTDLNRPMPEPTRKRVKADRAGWWESREHPRGMLGKKHSSELRQAASARFKTKWATDKAFGIGFMSEEARQRRSDFQSARAAATPASNCYSRTKSGKRDDLGGLFVRSSWEANYARYLNLLMRMGIVEEWSYEPETFWFLEIKRGIRSYKPDFRVKYKGDTKSVFVEIKGWMDAKSKTRLARMRKYYPEIKLEVVGAKEYRGIARKWASAIEHWEGAKK